MAGAQTAAALRAATSPDDRDIVRVENVVKHYPAAGGAVVQAVAGVDLEIRRGETLGLVGESGCGKSTLARLITALQPVTSGRIVFNGKDLSKLRGRGLRRVRRERQIIFQDPFASLDPRMTVGDIIAEPMDNFRLARGKERRTRVQELLRLCAGRSPVVHRWRGAGVGPGRVHSGADHQPAAGPAE